MPYQLTVGEVSTLIAAAVFIARFILPNAFALILVRLLGQRESAATWGFAQQSLAKTDWSVLLRTDSMANGAVNTRVRILNWLQLLTTTVLTVAAVLTPAGLYDTIRTTDDLSPTTFVHAQDQGVFGITTQVQNEWPWRSCGNSYNSNETVSINLSCPGSDQSYNITQNPSEYRQIWEGRAQYLSVNQSRAEIYQSGLRDVAATVSSFFDIKPRHIKRRTDDLASNLTSYLPVDSFEFQRSVIDMNDFQIIEGLVIDAKTGAVGFRNHSIPSGVPLGTSWEEDLLFLEVDVACADLNLSFVYDVPFTGSNTATSSKFPFQLIDNGGFANLNVRERPSYPATRQNNLSLHDRARATAWWTIYWTMRQPIMNLTTNGEADPKKSRIGQGYNSFDRLIAEITQTRSLGITTTLDALYKGIPGYNSTDNKTIELQRQAERSTQDCSGWNMSETVSISSIPVWCKLLIGTPTTLKGEKFTIAEEGMRLKRKIYAFVAAVKVTIKTVEFSFNDTGTTPLDGLKVLNISNKNYKSSSDMPCWAMETPPLRNGNISPLWGLVSKDYEKVANISTIRSPHLYPIFRQAKSLLGPSYVSSSFLTGSEALSTLLTSIDPMRPTSPDSTIDNGVCSTSLFRRGQILSLSEASASKIIKLVFTNFAANHIQGARGWLSEDIVPPPFRNLTGTKFSVMVPTRLQQRLIQYHWLYGIPAIFSLILIVALIIVASGAAVTGSIRQVSRYLALLSTGRLLTDFSTHDANEIVYEENYKLWSKTVGQRRIQLFEWGWKPRVTWQIEINDQKRSNRKESIHTGSTAADYEGGRPSPSVKARPFLGRESSV